MPQSSRPWVALRSVSPSLKRDGLQKGLIDGVLLPMKPIKGWKFFEMIKTTVENYAMAYTAPIFVVMNKDKWNSLPKIFRRSLHK